MGFSPKTNFYINQIKSNIKFIMVGIVVIALLAFGFVVSITLLAIFIIAIPIFRLWAAYKIKKAQTSSKDRDIGDFIDVEYEIIEKKEKRKK